MSLPLTSFPIATVPLSSLGFGKVEYVSRYTNLATAVAALLFIGDPVTLVIDIDSAVPGSLNVNAPITLAQQNGAVITVASGQTLYVQNPPQVGDSLFFVQADATANVTFGNIGYYRIAWFVGVTPTLCTNAINQCLTAINSNGGGTVMFPTPGSWTSAGSHVVPPNCEIVAPGIYATFLKHTANNVAMFQIGTGVRNIVLEGLVIDPDGHTGTIGFWCNLTTAGSSGDLHLRRTIIQGCEYGIKVESAISAQMANISLDASSKLLNNTYNYWCNTVNAALQSAAAINVGAGGYGMYLDKSGGIVQTGEMSGSTYIGHNQVVRQTVSLTGALVNGIATSTVTAAGMVGSPVAVSVPLPTGVTTAAQVADAFCKALANDPNVASFFHISLSGTVINLIALDTAANDLTMNFTIANGTAGNITPESTIHRIVDGVAPGNQAIGVYIGGSHSPIEFVGVQMEGFRESFVTDAGTNSNISFEGCVIQDPVRLNQQTQVKVSGSHIYDKVFRDGVSPFVASEGTNTMESVFSTFDNSNVGITFPLYSAGMSPTNFTSVAGSGVVAWDNNSARYEVRSQFPMTLYRNAQLAGASATKGWLQLLTNSTVPEAYLLELGKGSKNGYSTFTYSFYRNDTTGHLVLFGNQPGVVGLDFNGTFTAQGVLVNYGYSGFGYTVGAGGAITQGTSRTTTVVLNAPSGAITLFSAAGSTTPASFTVTNNTVLATDTIIVSQKSGTDLYQIFVTAVAAGSFRITFFTTGGTTVEAPVFNFAVVRASIT